MESLVYVASVESPKHLHCAVALYVAFVAFAGETVVVCARRVVVGGGVPEVLTFGDVLLVVHHTSPAIVDIQIGVGEAASFDKVFDFEYVVVAVAVGGNGVGELQEIVGDVDQFVGGVGANELRSVDFGVGCYCHKAHKIVAHTAFVGNLPLVVRFEFGKLFGVAFTLRVAEQVPQV